MSSGDQLLRVRDLHVHFGPTDDPVKAVDGVSLDIQPAETVALVGESGSGKSVTGLSLAKLVPTPPARYMGGSIEFMGQQIFDMGEDALRRLRGNNISYIFQEPTVSLNPVFRVGYQIAEAIRLHRGSEVDVRAEVMELLELVGIPNPAQRIHAYPHELSGGMQQRIMIAMALACRPKLLVADEPTTALDVTIQAQIIELLESLQKQLNMAVLLITHNLGIVADVAHRIHVMRNGKIVEQGATKSILRNPQHAYTKALLDAVPKLRGAKERLRSLADAPEGGTSKSEDMVSLRVRREDVVGSGDVLLRANDVHVTFGKRSRLVHAVAGVDIEIRRGESVGLVGESGCGKTTLGRTVIRLQDKYRGSITFGGQDVGTLRGSKLKQFRQRVQMIFQDPYGSLNPRMTIGNAIGEVLQVHKIGRREERKERIASLFEAVGLERAFMDRYPHEFSGGQRQRIGIARALALDPDLLIADEPVSALDVSVQAQILNLLRDLQSAFQLSYLFVSHDLAVVRYVCDRVYVMYQGRIVESGNPDEIYANPQHPYTQRLLSAVPDIDASLAQ